MTEINTSLLVGTVIALGPGTVVHMREASEEKLILYGCQS